MCNPIWEGIQDASKKELEECISRLMEQPLDELMMQADKIRKKHYGNKVFFRGLVEFSNYCRHDCYYCGLRKSNQYLHRYRLSPDEILDSCLDGYNRGFHSFVLQSGEDMYYNGGRLIEVTAMIKEHLPNCALTLSTGELDASMYQKLYKAGADRFLLRHESANPTHYEKLHPSPMTLESRKNCLYAIKESGMAAGAGFMVGSPGQTISHLADDLLFLKQLQPRMIGIGPFIPQGQTPFADKQPGTIKQTLIMLSLTRVLLPKAMLPATTALGTLQRGGRELALKSGANVVMPNVTSLKYRKDYMLYDGKIGTDDGIGEGLEQIKKSVLEIGYEPDFSKGDPV